MFNYLKKLWNWYPQRQYDKYKLYYETNAKRLINDINKRARIEFILADARVYGRTYAMARFWQKFIIN